MAAIIGIASGKGGTGKTSVSAALALASKRPLQVLDCDVEEPNLHLQLKPEWQRSESVETDVVELLPEACTACGDCPPICRYNALALVERKLIVFPELCRGCGGCVRICKAGALEEVKRPIGQISVGSRGLIRVIQGKLDVGNPLAPPLIRAVRKSASRETLQLIDCPPGTACAMVNALRGVDLALLVTEPTPFGLHDLGLAVETLRHLRVPAVVILNRSGLGDSPVEEYCRKEKLPLLARIPYSRHTAEVCARGGSLLDADPSLRPMFEELPERALEYWKSVKS